MRQYIIAIQFIAVLTLISCRGAADSSSAAKAQVLIDSLWQQEFSTAQEITDNLAAIRKQIEGAPDSLHTRNLCHYIWQSGEYMFRCRGKNDDIALLPQGLEEIRLDDKAVSAFMTERDIARFADHYFTLKAMKRGDCFEESRDGITMTVFYPLRSMNSNDYSKMKEVFSCKNDALHTAYMKKLKFPFSNSGCNEEFYSVRPYIEKNVKESNLKSEIIALFDLYRNTMPGELAPTPVLVDTEGKEHTFAEFRGKVLVIDIWATWCSSCLKKMPEFMALRNRYSDNPDVEFITVSIDRKEVREDWLAAIAKKEMADMLNLYPNCSEQSQLESDYHISGVPRYMVLDKEGKIVSAYAPPPGGGLEEIIENTIE